MILSESAFYMPSSPGISPNGAIPGYILTNPPGYANGKSITVFRLTWCLKGLNAKRYNNRVVEGTARNLRLSRLLCLSAFYAILDFTEFSDFSDFPKSSDLFRNLRFFRKFRFSHPHTNTQKKTAPLFQEAQPLLSIFGMNYSSQMQSVKVSSVVRVLSML